MFEESRYLRKKATEPNPVKPRARTEQNVSAREEREREDEGERRGEFLDSPTRATSSFRTSFFSSGDILAGYQSKMYLVRMRRKERKGGSSVVREPRVKLGRGTGDR